MHLLVIFLILGHCFLTSSDEGLIYYVKPSPATLCPGQPCETLQYLFDNINTTVNQHSNATLIFLNGNHSVKDVNVIIMSSILNMTGEYSLTSYNPTIKCGTHRQLPHTVAFYGVFMLHIKHLVVERCKVIVNLTSKAYFDQVVFLDTWNIWIYFSNATFTQCKAKGYIFRNWLSRLIIDSTQATMKDCRFFHPALTVFILHSSISMSETKFVGGHYSQSIVSSFSNLTLSGNILFANYSANIGGAMSLFLSTLNFVPGANVSFINNSANDKGGAIYIEPDVSPSWINFDTPSCFYHLLDCNSSAIYSLHFVNNSATNGGDDIYGGAVSGLCMTVSKCKLTVTTDSSSLSSVSSDPIRVCACDNNSKPRCSNTEYIYMNKAVHPGERFTISVVVVGWDYGTTTGIVYAGIFTYSTNTSSVPTLDKQSQSGQVISNNKKCTNLSFSIYAVHKMEDAHAVMYITAVQMKYALAKWYGPKCANSTSQSCCTAENTIKSCVHATPVFLSVTLLPCPPGFAIVDQSHCDCPHTLFKNCTIDNGTGHFLLNTNTWVSTYTAADHRILYCVHCPTDYCTISGKWIDLKNDPDSQCAFNRAGRLCGGCKDNYSLAIGSSHCIHCTNNNNLALFIFFVAAGFLLVFFITTLNLTVTQGMINGLIFYSNVVWTYQSIFFPKQQLENVTVLTFLRAFIAWINLDFGIDACFINGLTAFWKVWLQFLFPMYIWAIVALIIAAAKYSSKLTILLGNKAVPILATLFLLSYMKLLSTVGSILEFSTIDEYSKFTKVSTITVWSVDGNFIYFGFPHVLLFMVGLAVMLFLWMPYTFILLSMQWLRRLSDFQLLKWVAYFHPVYDAYFAPLKHRHQYLYGVLLLVRGILLMTFASTFSISHSTNLLLLLIFGATLSFYIIVGQPYKSTAVQVLQASFHLNLTLLSAFGIYSFSTNQPTLQAIAVSFSVGVAFLQFCGIVLHAVIAASPLYSKVKQAGCCKFDSSDGQVSQPTPDFTNSFFIQHQVSAERQPLIDTLSLST